MTILEFAVAGEITADMQACAAKEGASAEHIRAGIASGVIALAKNNRRHGLVPLAVGKGLRTKINANIGTSRDRLDVEQELAKLHLAVAAGADAVMDLSTGGDLRKIRQAIIAASPVAIGTVPIYQVVANLFNAGKLLQDMSAEDIFNAIEEHGEDGVDFITVHCGVTQRTAALASGTARQLGIVSRGGSIIASWMRQHGEENPLYEHYDRLLAIAHKYDMTLSLGDGLRPGCLADASDSGQFEELKLLGSLARRAREQGVMAIIEGPGHVPLRDIEANIVLQKQLCDGAPFYVLGPLPTDIAPGYDHITAAIGGAIAGAAGADFLCYVTPSEHLRLPDLQDVREGVIAAKIAAHIADIAKGVAGARERDDAMARYRKEFDWEGQINISLDPKRARELLETSTSAQKEGCTMCGDLCAIKMGK
jgi:phosphomethylpyrimidine synthase